MLGGRKGDPGSVGPTDVVRVALSLGDSTMVRAIGNLRLAIAPSGKRVAFIGPDGADDALWVRDLDQPGAHPLPDTKGAFAPFFSPDGQSLGFFTASSGQTVLKVIAVTGGVSRTLVADSVASFGGGDWGDDGQIYFTHSTRGLARVAPSGGEVTRISKPDSSTGVLEHDYPDVLPGSRRALVMLWKGSIGSNQIGLVDLKSGAVTELTPGSMARYVAPGFLAIGGADGRLMVARFDRDKARLLGTPALIMQDVQEENQQRHGPVCGVRDRNAGLPAEVHWGGGGRLGGSRRETDSGGYRLGGDILAACAVARRQPDRPGQVCGWGDPDLGEAAAEGGLQPALLRCQQRRSPGVDPGRPEGRVPRHPRQSPDRLDAARRWQ